MSETNEHNVEAALASFMAEENIDREEAMRVILRDWLIGHGYLPFTEDDAVNGGGDPLGI